MRQPKVFLTDTLNRLKRSIEITGTGMNFKGRKAIDFPEFKRRFLIDTLFNKGEDDHGYYGVQLHFLIDGTLFVFDTTKMRAMVYDKSHNPVIFKIYDEKMINYLNIHFSTDFGDYIASRDGGRARWRDYVSPKLVIDERTRGLIKANFPKAV